MTQYVFLSHSQKDIAKVRQVRDYLESFSFEPILFNLKCLKDSDELTTLIKREIEVRTWFLYLDSHNARESARVKAEVSFAKEIKKKRVYKVNLKKSWLMQIIALNRMTKNASLRPISYLDHNDRDFSEPKTGEINSSDSFWNCMGGGSVFISHSHKDLPKVRLIRNFLEKNGFDPLCFYMQCLTDEDEIDGLLKREIDARKWFAFMDSQNARQSAWVRKEREYIQRNPDSKILYYKLLDESPEDIANRIMDQMTVYLCYSERDKEYGSFVAQSLSGMGFRVFDRCDEEANGDDYFSLRYQEQTEAAIRDAAKHGCFLFLMTDYSKRALMMRKELEYAIMYGAAIAVAFLGVDEWDISNDLRHLIRCASCESIEGDQQTGMMQIASLVGKTLLQNGDDFI